MSTSPAVPEEKDLSRPTSPVILYNPPTALTFLRSAAINLVLPFINGLMLGFGELFAHEIAFRWGWGSTRVFPESRIQARRKVAGPGIEVREHGHVQGFSDARGLKDLTCLD